MQVLIPSGREADLAVHVTCYKHRLFSNNNIISDYIKHRLFFPIIECCLSMQTSQLQKYNYLPILFSILNDHCISWRAIYAYVWLRWFLDTFVWWAALPPAGVALHSCSSVNLRPPAGRGAPADRSAQDPTRSWCRRWSRSPESGRWWTLYRRPAQIRGFVSRRESRGGWAPASNL